MGTWKHRLSEINLEEKKAICAECGLVKIWAHGDGGYVCSTVSKERAKKYNALKRDKIGYTTTQHRLSNIDLLSLTAYCSKCQTKVDLVKKATNRLRCINKIKESYSTRTYSTTLEKMFKDKQKPDLCACCGREGKLVRDHCHTRSVARDWICYSCNIGLGQFGDDILNLKKAIKYLERHQS